ncbi:sodium/pantothenate symporter [Aeromonas simiae]|uniref:sodium/pantothenate symporter n=1 Tax=Aeromonas simiae TaxID=218936 RepID=UPI00266CE895|nr:sodium/pantothenate symporter [Aeromonas simiae]MDO2949733.1 sodium/pantothenate symporter [Aeromonas simiae]MDO2953406.1 sodium/pantothenate symporter [Aeromonas simiae]MDO2957064.1 sodium/pantothenate symporter [Aeromonas simiae]
MNPELLIPLFIYLVLVLAVGFWASRHRSGGDFMNEYFIGNRSMGGLVLAMTLVATYTSASSFIGGPGAAYKVGLGWVLLAMIQLPTVWLTLGVLGKKFAIIARRVNAVTINDMLWARYRSRGVVIVGSLTIVLAFIATMVVQFIGGARLLETATGLSYQQGLFLFAGCVLLYTVIGGFRAVVMTDALQGVIMVIGTAALLGGILVAGDGLPQLIHELREIDPKLVTPSGAGDMLSQPFMLSFWVLVCLGVIGLPHSAVRCFGYRDSRALHRAILIGTVVSAFLMFGMHLAGALGRAILPGMDSPDKIMPALMMQVLPPWLAGVFLAAPMAAIMSTIDSQLIQASATLVKDLWLNYVRPSEEKMVVQVPRLSLLCTLILGTLVLIAALKPPEMIIWLNLLAFGGLQAVFLWPLVLGLYWPRANGAGALVSMMGGALCYGLLSQFKLSLWGTHAIVPSLLLGLVCFVLTSLLTPPPSAEVARLFEQD